MSLESDLMRFTGVAGYYRPQPIAKPELLLTEGTWFLAEKADAFWLMEKIAELQEHPKLKKLLDVDELQYWRIEVDEDNSAILSINVIEGKLVFREFIKHTTLPLKSLVLCFDPQVLIHPLGYAQVCSLPSE